MSIETQPELHQWTRRAAWLTVLACLPALLLDWPVHHHPDHHPHFPCENWWGFFSGLGLLACLILVALSKLWQPLVRRPEEYYGE